MVAESEVVLKFPPTEALHPPILQLDEVDFRYPTGDRVIFRKVDLSTAMESRICIVSHDRAVGCYHHIISSFTISFVQKLALVRDVERSPQLKYFRRLL